LYAMYWPIRGSGASGIAVGLDPGGADPIPFRPFWISGIDSLRLGPGDCTLMKGAPGPFPCPPTLTPGGGMLGL